MSSPESADPREMKPAGNPQENSTADWDRMFARLVDYYHKHGHCLVEEPDDNHKDPEAHNELRQWVRTQQLDAQDLSSDQRDKLDFLHFFDDPHNKTPSKKKSNSRSGRATTASSQEPQPHQLKGYQRDLERIAAQWNTKDLLFHPDEYPLDFVVASKIYDRLQAAIDPLKHFVGKSFDQRAHRWNVNFEKLRAHRATFGHCQVLVRRHNDTTKRYSTSTSTSSSYFDKSLAAWVRNQHHRREALTPARDDRLDVLGFWVSLDEGKQLRQWSSLWARLEAFVEETKELPQTNSKSADERELASWIKEQQRHCNDLTSFQRRKLESLGVALEKDATRAAVAAKPRRDRAAVTRAPSDDAESDIEIRRLPRKRSRRDDDLAPQPTSPTNVVNSNSTINRIILRTPPRPPAQVMSPVHHYASVNDLTPRKKHCRVSNNRKTPGSSVYPSNSKDDNDHESEELRSFAAACYQRIKALGKISS